ncbi:MAG TPA: ATP-dependent 6-phosphofructokinase [Sneathiellales bacterium]|nr:ATP-dependent 6-phosphofructokinase [Sneathiellales bacterium]
MPQSPSPSSIKRIGVLTSGGDCSGLNAVIRAVVFRATQTYEWQVYGIHSGALGLMERPLMYEGLNLSRFQGHMLRTGGTMLGTTSKGDPFHYPMPDGSFKDHSGDFVRGFQELGLDALIGIGGDGSLNLLSQLTTQGGIAFVGIPKTIDNDVALTEFAVGFATAVSHNRVMILEVMGRDAGHIAISAGLAGGADVILLPEIPYLEEGVITKLKSLIARGQNHALMVVAEGVEPTGGNKNDNRNGIGDYLGDVLGRRLDAVVRVTVLGHLQRGGAPCSQDRILAQTFGTRAVDMVAEGKLDRMVAWRERGVVDVALDKVVRQGERKVLTDGTYIRTARALGVYVGEDHMQTTAERVS